MRDEMNVKRYVSWAVRCLGIAVVLSVAAYASYVGVTWYRYGHVRHTVGAEGADPLLDSFMPAYDVAGRQHLRVDAPAQTTFSAERDMNLQQSVIVRAIFRTRELILGSGPEKEKARPLGLVDQAKAWGWVCWPRTPATRLSLAQ
jgi:hypothetical protein